MENSSFAQPKETGFFYASNLVEIIHVDSSIHLDIRYATKNNFMGRAVYKSARAFLQKPAVIALIKVQKKLKQLGFGLLIFDAYRPWQVTKDFWDFVTEDKRKFVANPQKGSKHNRGCSVDLSLYDLKTGKEIEMPSAYDEFSERAAPNYAGGTIQQKKYRDLLKSTMEGVGFKVDSNEWWHYNYKDWQKYKILNIPFEDL